MWKRNTVLTILCMVLAVSILLAETFNVDDVNDFNNGTYINTHFNTSINSLVLNTSSFLCSYASQVFDAGQNATWRNISFVANATGDLPQNGTIESLPGGFNMSRNVLLYHLNNDSAYGENVTFVYDFSGSGRRGTWNGGGNVTADAFSNVLGRAGSFDSVDDDITTADAFPIMTNGTLSAWIYRDQDTGTVERMIGNDDEYELVVGNTDDISCQFYRAGAVDDTGVSAATLNTWFHVVCVWDNTTSRGSTYVNGFLDANYSDFDGRTPTLSVMYIGDSANNNVARNQNFPGRIDEVSFWNRTLSNEEIRALYKRGIVSHNLSVRSCDDSACSGEGYVDVNESTPVTLTLANNRYFQYNFTLISNTTSNSTGVYNVSINYNVSEGGGDVLSPTVFNLVPINNSILNITYTIQIAANVTDDVSVDTVLANITQTNGSTVLISLSQAGGTPIYNNTYYVPPITGVYNISFIANDTSGNTNRNQSSQFSANAWCGINLNRTTTLIGNVQYCVGDGIVIRTANNVLDCSGYDITGMNANSSSDGIKSSVTNTSITNCNVSFFNNGIHFVGSAT